MEDVFKDFAMFLDESRVGVARERKDAVVVRVPRGS